jgi:6-phosphogluconate dehydrogenase
MDAAVTPSTRVSLAGLGKMGTAIAERIVDAGYPLAVHNRTPERAQPLVERGASAWTTSVYPTSLSVTSRIAFATSYSSTLL